MFQKILEKQNLIEYYYYKKWGDYMRYVYLLTVLLCLNGNYLFANSVKLTINDVTTKV
jgi:hypothetical protein